MGETRIANGPIPRRIPSEVDRLTADFNGVHWIWPIFAAQPAPLPALRTGLVSRPDPSDASWAASRRPQRPHAVALTLRLQSHRGIGLRTDHHGRRRGKRITLSHRARPGRESRSNTTHSSIALPTLTPTYFSKPV